ncbi:MAG: hypothetical protein RL748_147 [Pseudomonadota bacterium]
MPINAVSSSATAATVSAPTTQSLRQTTNANQSSESSRVAVANANAPEEPRNGVSQAQRVQAPQPSVNTRGQTVGSTINVTA